MPFVKKQVVVPYSRNLLRASADGAAREAGPTQMGPATIVYWKMKDGTAFYLLNIDRDGWAGVSFTRAYCHLIIEKTLLQQFKTVKRVVWNEAPGESPSKRAMLTAEEATALAVKLLDEKTSETYQLIVFNPNSRNFRSTFS